MPTNQNAYNSRVTDEALEKRFRDTFKSQSGSELVDDLYASGVIVPVVDFTQAAEGSQLPSNLQTAWDFTTGLAVATNETLTAISNAGFWRVDATANHDGTAASGNVTINITDGLSTKIIFSARLEINSGLTIFEEGFIVFLRANDSLTITSSNASTDFRVWYRQIATVDGDLVNPFGFTSS